MGNGAFKGKVALVTGAARGQGLAIAQALARGGAAVAMSDIGRSDLATVGYPLGSSETLEREVAALRAEGATVLAGTCDVRQQGDVDAFVARTVDEFGGLDIVVNNAGILTGGKPSHEIDDATWDMVIAINLTGVFRISRATVPHLIARGGGRIINIASVAGLIGTPNFGHYCASKHGVVGLTKAMAAELAEHDITVNAVCPGAVDTTMVQHSMTGLAEQIGGSVEDAWQTILSVHLIKKAITPDQIAAAVLYLASEAAALVTGSCLSIDGGWSTT
jgi:NAD(P)-dependent dehydrogenase (short-subunit alcohol dehydrogenase family)